MEISINNVDAIKVLHSQFSLCTKGPWYDLGGTGLNLHRTRDRLLHDKERPFWENALCPGGKSSQDSHSKSNPLS
jgi:hypothetical protein